MSERLAGRLLLAALVVLGAVLLGRHQILTGDEPRYLMYALAALRDGRFQMDLAEWREVYHAATGLEAVGLPMGADGVVMLHAPYVSALLSPLALVAGLAGLRAVSLVTGLGGLFLLFRLCCGVARPGVALAASLVAALSLPLLPYLHLFYMESLLFTMVTAGWLRLQRRDRGWAGDLATALLLLAIPFVHLRGSVVAAALMLWLLGQAWRRGRRGRACGLGLLAVLAFLLLVGLNLAVFGVVTGPVNSARPPLPWEWPDVIAMQLFNVRHGLLAYAPVWVLGLAGLLAGAVRGPGPARQGLVLLLIATTTGMGVNPGECWPARFWVLAVPMLTVGLARFGELMPADLRRGWPVHLSALLLLGLTMLHSAVFFVAPNAMLENRQSGITFQRLYERLGTFNPGLMLPVETGGAEDVAAARALALAALVIALSLAACTRRPALALPALLLIAAGFDLSRVARAYTADVAAAPGAITIRLERPVQLGWVQIGEYWQTWYAPPRFSTMRITSAAAGGGDAAREVPANQVARFGCAGGAERVVLAAPTLDWAAQGRARLLVYESRSLLWRWLAPPGRC